MVKRTKALSISIIYPDSTNDTFDGALAALLRSLPLLPNLTALDIDYAAYHVATFFRTITSCSLARRLQQLSLSGPVEMFASIQEYCTHKTPFENLTKLSLTLHRAIDKEDKDSSLTLGPFLRSLAPTLQSLQITNRSVTLDLSPLFSVFSQHDSPVLFPNLKSLSLRFHFDTCLRVSHQSLHDFLLSNNNLHHLHLVMSLSLSYQGSEEPLGAWLIGLSNNVPFPSLQSLDIYPSDTQAGRSAVLTLIKRTAPTLSSLKIVGHCWPCHIADQVANAFKGREVQQLKSLSLNIAELSVSFLDLLARNLPQLEKLSFWTFRVVGPRKVCSRLSFRLVWFDGHHFQNSFYKQLERRRYRPGIPSTQDVLHTWKLCDLKIRVSKGSGDFLDVRALRAVAGAVPALARRMEQQMGNDEDSDENSDENR